MTRRRSWLAGVVDRVTSMRCMMAGRGTVGVAVSRPVGIAGYRTTPRRTPSTRRSTRHRREDVVRAHASEVHAAPKAA